MEDHRLDSLEMAKNMVVSMHNHPSLSLVSATDIRFFLQYGSIRLW